MRKRSPILPSPASVRGIVHVQVGRCKGCELCIDYCPTRVLALSTDFNLKGYHYPIVVNDNCINCQACYSVCPDFAIFATSQPLPENSYAAFSLSEGGQKQWRDLRS